MKKTIVSMFVIAAFVAVPIFAQSRSVDVSAFANWVDLSGDHTFQGPNAIDNANLNFNSKVGYGAAINVFWADRISTEFAVSVVNPDVAFTSNNPAVPAFTGGSLQMIPITGTLQYHFNPNGRVDPYLGAGVAYVLFDNVDNISDLNNVTLRKIDFQDDGGFVANAGLSFDLSPHLAILGDVKYVPVRSSAKAEFASGPGQTTKVDINPLMVAAGLSFQF